MRYTIEQKKLDDDHPLWPEETLYKIFDNVRRKYFLGSYVTIEAAEKIIDRRKHEDYIMDFFKSPMMQEISRYHAIGK